ncbi:MAG: hypothetical protein ACOWWR_08315 [Eubacteriales bacterium]
MPYIEIKVNQLEGDGLLECLNERIAEGMNVSRERIILSWEALEYSGFYRHPLASDCSDVKPVVIIRVSTRNGEEFMKKLADVVVEELALMLMIPKQNILLFIHPIEIGNTYINGEFV